MCGGSRCSAALADLVLPRICAGCGVPGAVLCRALRRALARPHLAAPRRFPWGFPPTVAAAATPGRCARRSSRSRNTAGPSSPAAGRGAGARRGRRDRAVPGRDPVLLVPLPDLAGGAARPGRDHVRELTRAAVVELRAAGVGPVGRGCWAGRAGSATRPVCPPRSGGPTWPGRSPPAGAAAARTPGRSSTTS